MIRDNISEYNLIENFKDETIIGFYEDLMRYYKEVAKDYIDKLDPLEYESAIEILDLMRTLQDNYNSGIICDEDLLEIGYCEMGAFTFVKRVREQE